MKGGHPTGLSPGTTAVRKGPEFHTQADVLGLRTSTEAAVATDQTPGSQPEGNLLQFLH